MLQSSGKAAATKRQILAGFRYLRLFLGHRRRIAHSVRSAHGASAVILMRSIKAFAVRPVACVLQH
jgi:hypothetical protein